MISDVEIAMHQQEIADYPWNKKPKLGEWREVTAEEFKKMTTDPFKFPKEDKVQPILDSIRRELETATKKHGPFNSGHEGYAVLKEELDELWEAVKRNSHGAANREAIQIAAMAVRFILDNK